MIIGLLERHLCELRLKVKDEYRGLAECEASIPLFSRPWWLDTTAGTAGWDVALARTGGEIVAVLPYATQRVRGLNVLGMPPLTPRLGPWLKPTSSKEATRLGREKDLIGALLDALPDYAHYSQLWQHSITNWLPAYWRGFSQSTRYTYRIPQLEDETKIWDGMQANIRTDVRKAAGRNGIRVRSDCSIDEFLDVNAKTFARQSKPLPYARDFLERLDTACAINNARKIFVAEDSQGRIHAGVYLVWDQHSAYYLMGGGDPELRGSGATSLCMWEAIRFAATVTKSFDFEGSMIEPIERFFRAFGAVQTPYFEIRHTKSWQLRAIASLRGLLKV